MKVYAKEGQTSCYNCGQKFQLDNLESLMQKGISSTSCPNPECNLGSWVQMKEDRDYCVPIEIDFFQEIERRLLISIQEAVHCCLLVYRMGLFQATLHTGSDAQETAQNGGEK